MDRRKQTITRQKRRTTSFLAVLFVDLDDFSINDNLGHKAGDQLLKDVASALNACVPEEDTVCRYGGDKFVIILSELASESDAMDIAEKLLKSISTAKYDTQRITRGVPRQSVLRIRGKFQNYRRHCSATQHQCAPT
jgi:diguanylate cyclase (GGDEF)-like protein